MCISPRVITRPSSDWEQLRAAPSQMSFRQSLLFKHDLNKHSKNLLRSQIPFKTDQIVVPCGHCIECLRRRQNDLATRVAREADKMGSFHFLTLTYRDSMLPLSVSLFEVNKVTGECLENYVFHISRRWRLRRDCIGMKPFLDTLQADEFKIRSVLLRKKAGRLPRYLVQDAPFEHQNASEGWCYQYRFTPSICRKDVRLWIKNARVKYERVTGSKLPDFSYVIVGEFGPTTSRPHYHLGLFGLSSQQIHFMAQLWYDMYGAYNLKQVSKVNEDGSSGFVLAAKYIGKYMTKGKFECDSVICGYAEKPRLCMSKGFGSALPASLIAYYRCYDLYGRYDINSLKLDNGSVLNDKQLFALSKEIIKRNKIVVDGYEFGLPQVYKHHLWYYTDYDLKNKKVLRASTIRRYVSDALRNNFISSSFREIERFRGKLNTAEGYKEFIAFQENSWSARKLQAKASEEALASFYNQSIF